MHVLEVLEGDVVGVPAVDRDQVALDVRVLRGELRHRLERRALDEREPRVAVLDPVRGRGRRAQPGLGARRVGVLPEVEHDDLGARICLCFRFFEGGNVFGEGEKKVRLFFFFDPNEMTSKKARKKIDLKKKKKNSSYREPDRGRVARVEPDLADRLDRRHARERDLHLAEEVGGSRVALGDVLVFSFCFKVLS